MSTKSASCAAAAQVARSARSPRSPTPHDSSERTWYSCACRPTTRPSASAGGQLEALRGHDERRLGRARVDRRHVEVRDEAVPAHRQVPGHLEGGLAQHPPVDLAVGRSTGRPAAPSRTVPSSSTTSSRMPVPATHVGVHPRRPALPGDDGGGQRAAPGRELDVGQRRARPRRPPRRRRRARSAPPGSSAAETTTCRPCQSQYSVATPWAWASSTSRGGGGTGTMAPSCQWRTVPSHGVRRVPHGGAAGAARAALAPAAPRCVTGSQTPGGSAAATLRTCGSSSSAK